MISDIKELISMIFNLYKSNMDKKYDEFNDCIADIFEKTKRIEENYIFILSKLRYGIVYECWNGNLAIKYLRKVEFELKSERVYIREELKHLSKIYNGDLEAFVGAILNIMYCDHVDRLKIGKNIEHRFSGLIMDAKEYQFNPFYKDKFIRNINKMLDEVNGSWEIVCSTYFILKEKYKNKI